MTSVVSPNNDDYPYSAVVYVESTFADGTVSWGSGVMVGPNDVLTAAHVLYDDMRGAAVSVEVSPGYSAALSDSAPFGTYAAAEWSYYDWDFNGDNFATAEEVQWDVGLIGLSSNVGNETGWFGIDTMGTSNFYNLSGYPASHENFFGFQMTDDFGYAEENPDYFVFDFVEHVGATFEVDDGMSGGPLWYQNVDSPPAVVGVLSTASHAADLYLTFDQILTWMDNDDLLVHTVPPGSAVAVRPPFEIPPNLFAEAPHPYYEPALDPNANLATLETASSAHHSSTWLV